MTKGRLSRWVALGFVGYFTVTLPALMLLVALGVPGVPLLAVALGFLTGLVTPTYLLRYRWARRWLWWE